jgi:hypothetical protein
VSRSYIGAKVRLTRDVVTRGGQTFKKGLVMRVIDSVSSGLWLRCWKRGFCSSVRNVSKYEVEVVEWPKKKED